MYLTITVGLVGPLKYDSWAAGFFLVFVLGQLYSVKELYNPFHPTAEMLETSQLVRYGVPYLLGLVAVVWGVIASLSGYFRWI